MNVRMMLPMDIRCTTCRNFTYKGTKFNAIKEDVPEETYLGSIRVYRFYYKCKDCANAIIFKTDPQNSDYAVEFGATRNFEPWRARDEQLDKEKKRRIGEEMGDPMKSLENRTLDSKREMDVLACLDELKSMRSRRAVISPDALLGDWEQSNLEKQRVFEAEDEALTKSVFDRNDVVRRINDDYVNEDEDAFESEKWAVSGPSKKRNVLEDFPNDFSKTRSIFKSSLIRLVPGIKKSAATHSVAKSPQSTIEITEKHDLKQTNIITDDGLQYLFSQYCSEDEDQ